MKRTGRHPQRALTTVKVRALRNPGRYADGNGLYLIVDPSGAKRWVLRTVVQGRRRDLGLGGVQLVSLAEARDAAHDLRKSARKGGDPVAERRKARAVVPTFEEAARSVHTKHSPAWRNAKHSAQWINTLQEYAFPFIGSRRVDQIGTADILRVLAPIWLSKPETARRVRQRIGTVLDWTRVAGFRAGENPVDGVAKALPKQRELRGHHGALPYTEVPEFLRRLHASAVGQTVKFAFEFLILTAARTGEVVGAEWNEIDFDAAIWTVPAARMKSKRVHRVPLPPRCVQILRHAREIASDSDYIFPGRAADRPISNMAFLMTLRRMDIDATAHGFRSAFRDWAAECTNFPREVCEMALAHTIKDKVEAAYRRGDLFDKRRRLMEAWTRFVNEGMAKIVPIRPAHAGAQ